MPEASKKIDPNNKPKEYPYSDNVPKKAPGITRRDFLRRGVEIAGTIGIGAVLRQSRVLAQENKEVTQGRVFYVDSENGNDNAGGLSQEAAKKSLDQVCNLLRAGDTVCLLGNFKDSMLYSNTSGTEKLPIVFKSLDSKNPAVISNSDNQYCGFVKEREFLKFEGINFKADRNTTVKTHQFEIINSNNITVSECSFENVQLELVGSSSNTISGNLIRDFAITDQHDAQKKLAYGDALMIRDGSSDNSVTENVIENATHAAFTISTSPDAPESYRNRVARNYISNTWAAPVYLAGGQDTIFEYNVVGNGACEPQVIWPENNGNVISERSGIGLRTSKNVIRGNLLFNNTQSGISLDAFSYVFDPQKGIYTVYQATDNLIKGNIIVGNQKGAIRMTWNWQDNDLSSSEPQVQGNTFQDTFCISNNDFVDGTSQKVHGQILIRPLGKAHEWYPGLNGNQFKGTTFIDTKKQTPYVLSVVGGNYKMDEVKEFEKICQGMTGTVVSVADDPFLAIKQSNDIKETITELLKVKALMQLKGVDIKDVRWLE